MTKTPAATTLRPIDTLSSENVNSTTLDMITLPVEASPAVPVGNAAANWPWLREYLAKYPESQWDPTTDIVCGGYRFGVHGIMLVINGKEFWVDPKLSEKALKAASKAAPEERQKLSTLLQLIKLRNAGEGRTFNPYDASKCAQERTRAIDHVPHNDKQQFVVRGVAQIIWPQLQVTQAMPWKYLSNGQVRSGALLASLTRGLGNQTRAHLSTVSSKNYNRLPDDPYISEMIDGRWLAGAAYGTRMRAQMLGRDIVESWAKQMDADQFQYVMQLGFDELALCHALNIIPKRRGERRMNLRQIQDTIESISALCDQARTLKLEAWPVKLETVRDIEILERNVLEETRLIREREHTLLQRAYAARGMRYDRYGFNSSSENERVYALKAPMQIIEKKISVGKKIYLLICAAFSTDLGGESDALGHCVRGFGYGGRAAEGSIHILLMREYTGTSHEFPACPQGFEPCITIEMITGEMRVVQARGKHNRAPTDEESAALYAWAKEVGASISATEVPYTEATHAEVLELSEFEAWAADKRLESAAEEIQRIQEQREQATQNQSRMEAEARAEVREILARQLSEDEVQENGAAIIRLLKLRENLRQIYAKAVRVMISNRSKPINVRLADGTLVRHPKARPDTPTRVIGQEFTQGQGVINTPEGRILTLLVHARKWLINERGLTLEQDELKWRVSHGGIRVKHTSSVHKTCGHYWHYLPNGMTGSSVCEERMVNMLRQTIAPEHPELSLTDMQILLNVHGQSLFGLRPKRLPRRKNDLAALREWAANWQPGMAAPAMRPSDSPTATIAGTYVMDSQGVMYTARRKKINAATTWDDLEVPRMNLNIDAQSPQARRITVGNFQVTLAPKTVPTLIQENNLPALRARAEAI